MRERIEKKLGCSIEQFKKILDEHDKKYKDCETEGSPFPDTLTYDELDYIGEQLIDMAS